MVVCGWPGKHRFIALTLRAATAKAQSSLMSILNTRLMADPVRMSDRAPDERFAVCGPWLVHKTSPQSDS